MPHAARTRPAYTTVVRNDDSDIASTHPSVSRSATILLRLLISTKDRGFRDRVRWMILMTVRKILIRFGDPTAEYPFCGSTLRIPLSHDLPLIRRSLPLYSDNLGRIAGHLARRFGAVPVIDIGANVGDSVAIIHHHVHLPILCVEGEPRYAGLLASNVASNTPAPVIERSFVGTGADALVAVVHDGTAKLEQARSGADAIGTRRFEQILARHPVFENSRLLKIDTDGMDVAILREAYSWISRQRPVLFFEYDPDLQRAHRSDGLEMLRSLRSAGYNRVLVYENIGDYMLSAELSDDRLFSELHEFFSGRQSQRYCDLCVFHRDEEELAESIIRDELDFFRLKIPPA